MDILFRKYLAGEVSEQEEIAVEQYFNENPYEDAPVFTDEQNEIGQRIKNKLMASVGIRQSRSVYMWLGVAACLAVGLISSYIIFKPEVSEIPFLSAITNSKSSDLEVTNTSTQNRTITLEDGSTVTLQPNSQLSYPEHFDLKKRQVHLRGEAFFNIKRNPSKPFLVMTDGLTTQVLGTSFSIKSYENRESIEVEVATGKVSVFDNSEKKAETNNGVILTPNQKIVFNKKSRKIEFGIVSRPTAIKPIESKSLFEFEDKPVGEVLITLETVYGIDIIAESDAFEKCLFTGDLNNLSMFEQLDLLCRSVNGTYERRGSSLFIHGEGCR